MGVWFASDIHLDADHADLAAAFVGFMRGRVAGAERFYVLGDLFETWVGDDDRDSAKDEVAHALAELVAAGTRCYFVHGNRDFLVGERFAGETGIELLPEHSVADLYGTRVLILHGDSLCTDDHEYQAFRRVVRSPAWQQEFLTLPLEQRRAMARQARDASRAGMERKPDAIMDVNQDAVVQALRRHDVTHMLHGHTHRPAVHEFDANGARCRRYVLGDWYDSGRVVFWDEAGPKEVTL